METIKFTKAELEKESKVKIQPNDIVPKIDDIESRLNQVVSRIQTIETNLIQYQSSTMPGLEIVYEPRDSNKC